MASPTPQILVTGASGTTGLATVRALSALGIPVRALLRDPAKAAGLALPGVEVAIGDFSDPESLLRDAGHPFRLPGLAPQHPPGGQRAGGG